MGTIPIIERNVLQDGYDLLPVAFVDQWSDLFNGSTGSGEALLQSWLTTLAPYYERGSSLRLQTLEVVEQCISVLFMVVVLLFLCWWMCLTEIAHGILGSSGAQKGCGT